MEKVFFTVVCACVLSGTKLLYAQKDSTEMGIVWQKQIYATTACA